ncbi:hypothetical protein [Aquimarina sp. I32.4]|uniref:hypothetical protein n=1 Tax=Aquimarina sp. I32.4 TaxID=2053903 RepID=UPI001E56958A|nr:hypothetical protein [Aquimarina sp. I32.4]
MIPILVFSQKRKAVLTLNDNSVHNGLAMIKHNDKIVFWHSNEGGKVKYNYDQVKQIIIFDKKGESTKYTYKKQRGKKKYLLLRILVDGGLLFYEFDENIYLNSYSSSIHMHTKEYYISKKDQDFVDRIRVGIKFKKFEKISNVYFKDCSDLISKIESKYFERDDHKGVKDLVIYYNENCSN